MKNIIYKYLPLVGLLFAGCTSIHGVQDGEVGRFLQMSVNGYLIFQMDTNNSAICAESAKSIDRKPNVKVVCATESRQYELPFYYAMTNALSAEKILGRARTNEACEIFVSEFKRDPSNRLFKYSECELLKNQAITQLSGDGYFLPSLGLTAPSISHHDWSPNDKSHADNVPSSRQRWIIGRENIIE